MCSPSEAGHFQCSPYSARKDGWIIESRRVRGGTWEYRLVGKGESNDKTMMNRPQREIAARFRTASASSSARMHSVKWKQSCRCGLLLRDTSTTPGAP